MIRICVALTLLAVAVQPAYRIHFVDITATSGIRFLNVSGAADKTRITDVNGSGVAVLDYDGDGLLDVYLVNGARDGKAPGNALYRNLGKSRFEDVTARAGVADQRWGMGVAVADYNNDGHPDIFVANYGRNTLFENRGGGTFRDVTVAAGLGGTTGHSAGAAFADIDRDGHVDLFVTRYIDYDPDLPISRNQTCGYKGMPALCGPGGYKSGPNILYRNRGDGTFEDITARAGVSAREPHYSFAAVFDDFDSDGWPDLFVANDSTENFLYHNRKDGTFREIGLESGVALSDDGRAQAGMGVAVRDYNNDGRPDIFVTNFSDDYNTLYRNEGGMNFVDVSLSTGIGQPSFPMLAWGALFEDFDNDGWPDAFTANGHIYPNVDQHPVNTTYRQWLQVFRNLRGRFTELGEAAGVRAPGRLAARSAAAGDWDNDGGVDVIVSQIDGPPVLLANRSVRGNWITVRLEGKASNRLGIGARVRVKTTVGTQWRTVQSGASFLSQNDLRLHFGLGDAGVVDELEVLWPSGRRSVRTGVPVNAILDVPEES